MELELCNANCTWLCYMIYSINNKKTYIGSTNNFTKRLETHNKGKGAKYTKGNKWLKGFTISGFEHKNECLSFESGLKKISKNRNNSRFENLKYNSNTKTSRILDLLFFLNNTKLLYIEIRDYFKFKRINNKDTEIYVRKLSISFEYRDNILNKIEWPNYVTIE